MEVDVPFYQRTLDSFSDETITKVHHSEWNGLWYAAMDYGPDHNNLMGPDFAPDGCGETREAAVAGCAAAIRRDHRGIGKFAPHECLRPGRYEFSFQLCRYWTEKEVAS